MSLRFKDLSPNRIQYEGGRLVLVCPLCEDTQDNRSGVRPWVIVNKTGTQVCFNCYTLHRQQDDFTSMSNVSQLRFASPWYTQLDKQLDLLDLSK